jgi:oxygen-independent coproporphyrinogen-3 oxidase
LSTLQEWIARGQELLDGFDLPALRAARVLPADGRFVPVITYPSLTQYGPLDAREVVARRLLASTGPMAVYIHVPFCFFRCSYCHWDVRVNPPLAEVDRFLAALDREMAQMCRTLGVDRIAASSVLIGGGTPTWLDPGRLGGLLDSLHRHVDVSACRQFSVEAEPSSLLGEVGASRLRQMIERGVDRISLGVQSFEDAILTRMGRKHTGADCFAAVDAIRAAGFASLSLDLIYGYPGQSVDDWAHSLLEAVRSGADAWQLYRLRIERHGDVQGRILEEFREKNDEFPARTRADLMKAIGNVVSVGHGRDEHFTRIFATTPAHVTQYMADYCIRLTDVAGFGPSSWSNYGRVFTQNIAVDLDGYVRAIEAGLPPFDRGLIRDSDTDARRSVVSPLKNGQVSQRAFRERLGFDADTYFAPAIAHLEAHGLLERNARALRLTPRGRFVADESVMAFYQRRYLPYPELAQPWMPE